MEDGLLTLITNVIYELENLRYEDTSKVFRYVGIFNNQIERLGRQNDFEHSPNAKNTAEVFDFPAAFIEYQIDRVDTEGQGTQIQLVRLLIHIAFNRFDLDKNWRFGFDLRARVHQALHLLKSANDRYSTLTRDAEQADFNHDNVYVWIQTYGVLVIDETAKIYRAMPNAGTNGNITVNYKIQNRPAKNV